MIHSYDNNGLNPTLEIQLSWDSEQVNKPITLPTFLILNVFSYGDSLFSFFLLL